MLKELATVLLFLIPLLILCNLYIVRKKNTKKGRIRFIHKSKNIFCLAKGYVGLGHTYVGYFVHRPNLYGNFDFLYFTTDEKNYIKMKAVYEQGNQVSLSYKEKFVGENVFVYDVIL